MRAGGAGARRLAASRSAPSSASHLHGPTMCIRIIATGMVPLTATAIPRTTAIAIRRTTATETGIIAATTPDVTDERLPAPIEEHGRGKPVRFFSVRL